YSTLPAGPEQHPRPPDVAVAASTVRRCRLWIPGSSAGGAARAFAVARGVLCERSQLADLVELAAGDVKDEPANRVLVRDKRAGLDPRYRLPNVLVEVGESLGGPGWLDSRLVLDGALELIVGEGQHAAVGVVDQHDLARPEKSLADGQGADLVVGDDAASVADHVRLTIFQAE